GACFRHSYTVSSNRASDGRSYVRPRGKIGRALQTVRGGRGWPADAHVAPRLRDGERGAWRPVGWETGWVVDAHVLTANQIHIPEFDAGASSALFVNEPNRVEAVLRDVEVERGIARCATPVEFSQDKLIRIEGAGANCHTEAVVAINTPPIDSRTQFHVGHRFQGEALDYAARLEDRDAGEGRSRPEVPAGDRGRGIFVVVDHARFRRARHRGDVLIGLACGRIQASAGEEFLNQGQII